MDGVPVKISEKYKPRKKISLPGSVLNKISSLKETKIEEYDFTFERSVIDKISQLRKIVEERKKESIKQLEDAVEEVSIESSPETSSPSPPSQPAVNELASPAPAQSHILTPMPVAGNAQFSSQHNVDNSFLSEFESDTSSPFDNMELKSINDLQELADVLGNSNSESKQLNPLNGVNARWNNHSYYSNNHQYFPVYSVNQGQGAGHLRNIGRNPLSSLCSPQHGYSSSGPVSPPYDNVYSSSASSRPPLKSSPLSFQQYYTSPTQSSNPVSESSSPTNVIDFAQSKLWTDLQSDVNKRQSINLENSSSFKNALDIAGSETCRIDESSNEISSLPNPFGSLSSSGQVLAQKISEMGFSLPRSSRAVQMFEGDEAKVIEFLLQVQKFEDSPKIPGDRVELALISQNFNEGETRKYLENIKKLMDLGFDEQKVVEALNKCKNDPDKALDILIS